MDEYQFSKNRIPKVATVTYF